jgi:hypothetical protein
MAIIKVGDKATAPSIRPSLLLDFANSKALDPRITFTRASTATYWDGHTTAKAEENLIPQSNFSSGWATEGKSTINLNNATAPDGTTTAAKMNQVATQNAAYYYDYVPIANTGKLTGSLYLKQGTQKYAYIQLISGSTSHRQSVLWDLNTGTQVSSDTNGSPTGVSHSITSTGNGWYRCTVTMDQQSSGNGYLLVGMAQSASPSWDGASVAPITGDASQNIYIWGPQLENRSSATAYTPTTSAPITKYQPVLQTAASDVPRFDHDPVTGESKGLLIEEARTNKVTHSHNIAGNAFGYTVNTTQVANTAIAPDGTQSADSLIPTSTNAAHYCGIPGNYSAGSGTETFSVFLKANGYDKASLILANQTGAYSANFDLTAGTIDTTGAANLSQSIVDVGNGWYRCSFSYNTTKANPYPSIGVFQSSSGYTFSAGDGFSGVLAWGAQIEVGSFPTSYIPTSGSTVTRSPDTASITGTNFNSWYSQQEGSIYTEFSTIKGTGGAVTAGVLSLYNGTYTNFIDMRNPVSQPYVAIYADASTNITWNIGSGLAAGVSHKWAVCYAVNDFTASTNGAAVSVYPGQSRVPVADRLFIGNLNADEGNSLSGHIRKVSYYPKRLSNAELQALTEE